MLHISSQITQWTEKSWIVSLTFWKRQELLFHHFYFKTVVEHTGKRNKLSVSKLTEKVKSSLFAGKLNGSTKTTNKQKTLLKLINVFSKGTRYKINIKNG